MEPVNIGILGAGRTVQRRMLPAFPQSQHGRLVAIASRRPGIAEPLVAERSEVQVYGNYDDILQDDHVQAVYIPAAGDQHHPLTIAAAEAGKHVLCEKPLACTVVQALEMQQACREAGVVLMDAFMWRHHPRALKMREMVQSGQIGELRVVNVSFSFDIDRSDWRLDPARGGGAVWDLGCYGVNCARYLTGEEPHHIYSRTVHWSTGADMTTQVALNFDCGTLANIDCSFEAPFRCRLEVVGTGGRLELDRAFQNEPGCVIQWTKSADRDAETEEISFPDADQFACELDHFCTSIRSGALLPPAEDGVANMRVMESIASQWT